MLKRHLLLAGLASFAITVHAADGACLWRDATAEEQRLDAAAFEGFDKGIGERMPDVQSVVVVLQGRIAYQYHRNSNPETLHDTQSVTKSALSVLMGAALQQGHLASIDKPVLELMPEWQVLNADPRTKAVTLRHLLSLTSGFVVDDTNRGLPAEQAWKRPLRSDPGKVFAYDNSAQVLIASVLAKVAGQPVADYAQTQLVQPLGMANPAYPQGLVHMRTIDMARIGQLFLQDGRWGERTLLPPGFVTETLKAHSAGGPPLSIPYGLAWWLPPNNTYVASGYGGQFIWVHPPRHVVVAVTSSVSPESNQRGQALQLIHGRVFQAIQKRGQPGACAP